MGVTIVSEFGVIEVCGCQALGSLKLGSFEFSVRNQEHLSEIRFLFKGRKFIIVVNAKRVRGVRSVICAQRHFVPDKTERFIASLNMMKLC